MRKSVLAALALVLFAAAPALAAEVAAGDKELNFLFSYANTDFGDDFESTDTRLDGRWGWYFTEMHEAGVELSYFKTEIDTPFGDTETDSTIIGAFYNLNFATAGSTVPYIGAFIDAISGDLGDAYNLGYGLEGGVKIYPWENAGFNFRAAWTQLQADDDGVDDADGLSIGAGILVKWGR